MTEEELREFKEFLEEKQVGRIIGYAQHPEDDRDITGTLESMVQTIEDLRRRVKAQGQSILWLQQESEDLRRERDELRRDNGEIALEFCRQMDEESAKREQAEASYAAMREALIGARDVILWMSGSYDFSPEGQAHVGWMKVQPDIERIRVALSIDAVRRAEKASDAIEVATILADALAAHDAGKEPPTP